jgi:hypothetical protein
MLFCRREIFSPENRLPFSPAIFLEKTFWFYFFIKSFAVSAKEEEK